MAACIFYTRSIGRVYLIHVAFTRVQVATCIKYTWPIVFIKYILIKTNFMKVLYTIDKKIYMYT
jgi:hypothetical protein